MRRFAALVAAAGLVLGACGSDERSFTAEGFVDEVNSHGAKLELGAPLDTTQEDAELYEVAIPQGGGTLKVTDSADAAREEHTRCDEAGLFCYRAANVVLIFEPDTTPQSLANVADAFKALQE
jgi:hypothetical protein